MERAEKALLWIVASEFAANYRIRITCIVLAALAAWNLYRGNLPHGIAGMAEPFGIAAAVLVSAGLAVRSWASGALRKGKGLTTWGPYRLCRHPLYLGTVLVVFGFALLLPNIVTLLTVFALVCVLYGLTIVREERRLAIKFGDEWKGYAAATPRLLPLGMAVRGAGPWSLAQWYKSREHRALLAAPLALAVLELWRMLS
jgi:protein-S-isoprenylcysteine O-methyltransferase Ste14